MPKLIHTQNDVVVNEYVLSPGTLRIGRLPENEIRMDDLIVSGRHARLSVEPSQYLEGTQEVFVEDLGSTNGTSVNGKALKPHKRQLLKHTDIVKIGADEFRFIDEEANAHEQTIVYLPNE